MQLLGTDEFSLELDVVSPSTKLAAESEGEATPAAAGRTTVPVALKPADVNVPSFQGGKTVATVPAPSSAVVEANDEDESEEEEEATATTFSWEQGPTRSTTDLIRVYIFRAVNGVLYGSPSAPAKQSDETIIELFKKFIVEPAGSAGPYYHFLEQQEETTENEVTRKRVRELEEGQQLFPPKEGVEGPEECLFSQTPPPLPEVSGEKTEVEKAEKKDKAVLTIDLCLDAMRTLIRKCMERPGIVRSLDAGLDKFELGLIAALLNCFPGKWRVKKNYTKGTLYEQLSAFYHVQNPLGRREAKTATEDQINNRVPLPAQLLKTTTTRKSTRSSTGSAPAAATPAPKEAKPTKTKTTTKKAKTEKVAAAPAAPKKPRSSTKASVVAPAAATVEHLDAEDSEELDIEADVSVFTKTDARPQQPASFRTALPPQTLMKVVSEVVRTAQAISEEGLTSQVQTIVEGREGPAAAATITVNAIRPIVKQFEEGGYVVIEHGIIYLTV